MRTKHRNLDGLVSLRNPFGVILLFRFSDTLVNELNVDSVDFRNSS
jgi:hypothetical protein